MTRVAEENPKADGITEAKERVSKGRTVQWWNYYRRESCRLVSPTPAHIRVPPWELVALLCVPVCMGCSPPKAQLAGGVLAWREVSWLGSRANQEDAKTSEDHAGGHGTDEDLEGHHHLLCLLAGSRFIPSKPGEGTHASSSDPPEPRFLREGPSSLSSTLS